MRTKVRVAIVIASFAAASEATAQWCELERIESVSEGQGASADFSSLDTSTCELGVETPVHVDASQGVVTVEDGHPDDVDDGRVLAGLAEHVLLDHGDPVETLASGGRGQHQQARPRGVGVEAIGQRLVGSVERPRPLGVSLWWTPGKSTGTDQTLVDWRCNSQSG